MLTWVEARTAGRGEVKAVKMDRVGVELGRIDWVLNWVCIAGRGDIRVGMRMGW